jgi:hypothetical protein
LSQKSEAIAPAEKTNPLLPTARRADEISCEIWSRGEMMMMMLERHKRIKEEK